MFIDSVKLTLIAGRGGNGVVAWLRAKFIPKGGPDGGDGGNGGSIIIKADENMISLEDYRHKRIIKAESGIQGGSRGMNGKSGKDLIMKVPVGTIIWDNKTKEMLHDLTEHGQEVLIAKGGIGGKGNIHFKTPTNQAPNTCTEGTPGEALELFLELKLLADIGFVGFPNAGKSTLMSKITHVKVKIAPYPFTTLQPNLSYIEFDDFSKILIADIPGIIKDAHLNRGLGLEFLRHIERSVALVFVIDSAGTDGRDPLEDFKVLRHEIACYNDEMAKKPFIVALNKTDSPEAQANITRLREELALPKEDLFEISALEEHGLAPLLERMRELAQAVGKKF